MREVSENANISKARSLAFQGALFGCALVIISLIPVRLGRFEFGMGLVPLIAVFLWPRGASKGTSYILIFVMGILADILGDGPLGFWALLYLGFYGVLQPDQRGRDVMFRYIWLRFSGWVFIAVGLIFVAGALFVTGRIASVELVMTGLTAIAVFPPFYLLRQIMRQIVVDPSERSYT